MLIRARYVVTSVAALALGAAALPAQSATAVATPAVEKTAKVGAGLYEIVWANNALYVAATGPRGANKSFIYKVDPATLQAVDSLDVSDAPAFGLGVNRKTNTLYTTNTRSSSVHAIDLTTMKIIKTITLPTPAPRPQPANDTSTRRRRPPSAHAREVIADEASNTIFVSDHQPAGQVWIINGETNELIGGIDSVGARATGLAYNAATKQLYTSNLGESTISVIDVASKKVVKKIPTGGEGSINIAFDAKGNRLFVANQKSGTATVLDVNSGSILATIPTGEGALGVNYNPATNTVYVANRTAGTTTVLNGSDYSILGQVETGTFPQTVAIDFSTNKAYVTNKAKRPPRNAPRDAKPVVDPSGDTVTAIALQ